MPKRMSQRQVDKLVASINGGGRKPSPGRPRKTRYANPDWDNRMFRVEQSEHALLTHIASKEDGSRVYREGWPDFLVIDGNGKPTLIEVKKNSSERLRSTQAYMFEALESIGLPIYVWSADKPDVLVPWRKRVAVGHGQRWADKIREKSEQHASSRPAVLHKGLEGVEDGR